MLQELTTFLHELSINNEKEWFDQNRDRYEALRADFTDLVSVLALQLASIDPNLQGLNPKACIFRINRDIRFAKDKTPYKTHFSAAFGKGKRGGSVPAYYFHIDHKGQLALGGGLYGPEPKQLNAIRDVLLKNTDPLLRLINAKEFKETFGELHGEKLKLVPRGYPKDHPQAELFKQKSFAAYKKIPIADIKVKESKLPDYIFHYFKILEPFMTYITKISTVK